MARKFREELAEFVVEGRQWGFGFGGLLDEGGGIGGLLQPTKVLAEIRVSVDGLCFAEVMEFGAGAAGETEVGEIKKIELATKG